MSNHPPRRITRELSLDDPRASTALNLILGGSSGDASTVVAHRLAAFHADCNRRELRPDLLFAAHEAGQVEGACVALVSPGSAALMLIPPPAPGVRTRRATAEALAAARKASASRSLRLLQLLQTPDDVALSDHLSEAGFTNITTLLYMQRSTLFDTCAREKGPVLGWITYERDTEQLFCQTLTRTYEDSFDCPELYGLRRPADILAGHRSAGEFDPTLWWLAFRDDEPVGVLLLAPLRSGEILEVVYVGVVPSARGQGIANCLLNHALAAAKHGRAQTLALAVDERNAPARRLYARWGFSEIGRRAAWIATNTLTETCASAWPAFDAGRSP